MCLATLRLLLQVYAHSNCPLQGVECHGVGKT